MLCTDRWEEQEYKEINTDDSIQGRTFEIDGTQHLEEILDIALHFHPPVFIYLSVFWA